MRILMVLGLVASLAAGVAVAKSEKKAEAKKETKAEAKKEKKVEAAIASKSVARADGLKIEDVKAGSGKEAKLGSKITVHYKGTLKNGKVFDSSYDAGQPITFELLEGRLIKGWTEGIPGMKVGGKRKLSIPYAMAYGDRGVGEIPPKSDLDFEVELVDVK